VNTLMCACQSGNAEAVSLLARRSPSIHEYVNATDAFLQSPLNYAAMANSLPVTKVLLESGAIYSRSLNHNKCSPLYVAVESVPRNAEDSSLELIRHYIRLGFSPNVMAQNGMPLLHAAVLKAHLGLVNLLLSCPDCDVNMTDRTGSTALHIAASLGHAPICQALIGRGANKALVNIIGETPLQVAYNSAAVQSKKSKDVVLLLD